MTPYLKIAVVNPIRAKSDGGKKVGRGCQARIDQAIGCPNKCRGCYAKRVTKRGDRFDMLSEREYNEVYLRDSIHHIKKEGIDICRCGSVTDPAHNLEVLKVIIEVATDENIKLIVTTKSLVYDKEIAGVLREGAHTLQVSLGMITMAQSNQERVKMAKKYAKRGVDAMFRITTDATIAPDSFYKKILDGDIRTLLTPLRVLGGGLAKEYNLDLNSYSYHKGYYRPLFVNEAWGNVPVCGEVNEKIFCANCLV